MVRILALVALALALTASAASAAPFIISPTADSSPGIAVDSTGTAHIAWGSKSGATNQITYCQVPRGATACTNTNTFANPGNLGNSGTTQVLIKGSQIWILFDVCCGGSEGILMRKSTDGGATFPPPTFKVSNLPAGFGLYRATLNQAGTGAAVNNDYGTRLGFVAFDGSTSGQEPASLGNVGLGDREVLGYADVDWLNSTTPFATQVGYLTNHHYTRIFDSSKTGYNNAANWLPEARFDTKITQSAIGNGPAGIFVAGVTTVDHPFGKDEIALYRLSDAGAAGAPIPLIQEATPPHSPTSMDLAQDGGGRLHVAWTDAGFDGKLYYEWSRNGTTFSPPQLIQLDPAAGGYDNRIAVAPDGGGWIISDSNNSGALVLAPLDAKGDSDPPARPAPPGGTTPPPTTPDPAICPKAIAVTKNASAVVRNGQCFVNAPKGSKIYTTTGTVRVGGIDLAPKGSSTLTVDTANGTIVSKGGKYEIRAGAAILGLQSIDWNLGNPIPVPGVSAFGVKLFGLGVVGVADIWFTKGEGRIQINLDLPSPLDSVHANTILRTTMTDGLLVDGFTVDGKNVPIGPVTVSSFNLAYSSGADTLEGAFAMKLPPGASDNVTGGIGLANGSFKHAELEIGPGVPPLPLPLFATPPITLQRIGASASNDAKGFRMAGKVAIVAGGEIAGAALVGVDGSLQLFIPSSRAYAQIRAEGKVQIVGVPLGGGFVQVRSDGPLTFGGSMSIDFSVIEASFATAGGINLDNGDFYASGTASAGVNLAIIAGSVKASSIVSSVGVAACGAITGEVPVTGIKKTIELGYQKPWGKDSELGGCEIDKYVPASLAGASALSTSGFGPAPSDPLARAAQAGGRSFTLKAGRLAGVKVTGAGGRPGFTLAGPGGRTVTVPPNMTEPVLDASFAAIAAGPDSVEVQVTNPKGGWTVTPDGGAPAVSQVYSAGVVKTPRTTASVRRASGAKRELSVSAAGLDGQSLLIRELLPGGAANELGRITANGRKAFTFTPGLGAPGKRKIEAVILNGNKVTGTKSLATYTAPRVQRLPAPGRVRLARKRAGRTNVTVSWAKVAGAASYRVLVTASDGRRQYLTAKRSASRITIPNVTYGDKLTVKVQAMPKLGPAGRVRTATSRAVKLKKPVKKKTGSKK